MAIPSSSVPFQVTFTTASRRQSISVSYFTGARDELLIQDEPGITLTENIRYELQFTCDDPNGRLYLDILDALPTHHLPAVQSQPDGTQYLLPSDKPIPLYWDGYIPWRPAVYHLFVQLGTTTYYTTILVKSKLVNHKELDIMRAELYADVQELAFELVRRHENPGNTLDMDIPNLDMHHLQAISSHARSLVASALDLMRKPNHGIAKMYEWVNAAGGVETDEWSARQMARRPPDRGLMLTPRRVLHHQRVENRWVVFISEEVLHIVTDLQAVLDRYLRQLHADVQTHARYAASHTVAAKQRDRKQAIINTVEQHVRQASTVLHALRTLRTTEWYQSIRAEVTHRGRPPFTHVIVRDARYRAFYQVWRTLNRDNLQVELNQRFNLQWRPTNELYEMWGFIKMVKALRLLGFAPTQGWLNRTQQGTWLAGEPYSGASVRMTHNDVTIQLWYDAEMPLRVSYTTLDTPVYTTNRHNRPDGRLDVFENNVYRGSLMFDCKYRAIGDFWNLETDPGLRPQAMEQISAYLDGPKSRFLNGEHASPVSALPVKEVWAIHPSGSDAVRAFEDYFVKLVRVKPGDENVHVLEELRRVLAGMLQNSPDDIAGIL